MLAEKNGAAVSEDERRRFARELCGEKRGKEMEYFECDARNRENLQRLMKQASTAGRGGRACWVLCYVVFTASALLRKFYLM